MGGVGDGLLSPCEGDCSPSSSSSVASSSASLSSGSFMSVSGRLLTKLPCCLGGFRTFLMVLMELHCIMGLTFPVFPSYRAKALWVI